MNNKLPNLRNFIISVLTGLLSGFLINTFLPPLRDLFCQQSCQNSTEYYVVIGLIIAAIVLFITLYVTLLNLKKTSASIDGNVHFLKNNVSQVKWRSSSVNHAGAVYKQMTDLIKAPNIKGVRIFTILQPEDVATLSDDDREKIQTTVKNYFKSIYEKVQSEQLIYERVIVFRKGLNKDDNPSPSMSVENYLKDRPELMGHIHQMKSLNSLGPYAPKILYFEDNGRIIDIAFAIFYKDIEFKFAESLVMEISVRNAFGNGVLMGLLVINNPDEDLANSFDETFQSIIDSDNKLDVIQIDDDLIVNIIKEALNHLENND